MIIKINQRVSSNEQGFNFLNYIYKQFVNKYSCTITLDFKECKWFDANLSAVLGAYIDYGINNMNSFNFINMNNKTKTILLRNNFLRNYISESIVNNYNTTIKYKKFDVTENSALINYIDQDLFKNDYFPKFSKINTKKLKLILHELFENAKLHGKTNIIYTCGQYYHQKSKLVFTIVNLGTTFKENVNNFKNTDYDAIESIRWALEDSNTTKQLTGGIGFTQIKKFLELISGKIDIISDNGYVEVNKNSIVYSKILEYKVQGSIINIEIPII